VVLALAGSLLAFTGWGWASEAEVSTEVDVSAAQERPDAGAAGSRNKKTRLNRIARKMARAKARRELMAARMQEASEQQAAPAAPLRDINVVFKLDPRLTRGMYMGDRWVSTSSGVQQGKYTAEARVQGVDANGRPVEIGPKWTPADPEMVTVSPGQEGTVEITVTRPGQSSLRVSSEGVTRTLSIKAEVYRDKYLKVDITQ
jgi:hypothetical protein